MTTDKQRDEKKIFAIKTADQLQAENAQLRQQVVELRAENERLKDGYAASQADQANLRARIAKMDAALATLSDYKEVCEMERDDIRRIAREARSL